METNKIREFVLKLGVQPHLDGYKYIIKALELILENEDLKYTRVYEDVADIYNKSLSRVERAMRHSIMSIFKNYGALEMLEEIFHCSILGDHLTVSQFLGLCVETLKHFE